MPALLPAVGSRRCCEEIFKWSKFMITLISPLNDTLLFGLYFAQVRLCFALTLKEGVGVGDLVLELGSWFLRWESHGK